MGGKKKPVSVRSAEKRFKTSITCRSGGHGFCSGQVFLRYDNYGKPMYVPCRCPCHRS